MQKKHFPLISILFILFSACGTDTPKQLPLYGEGEITETGDTLPFVIPDFEFVDQDSKMVSNSTFKGKIYVTDFFFTTCPTICPRMKDQMLRIYEKFKDNEQVLILSHSIDPVHDSVSVLNDFAYNKLGIEKGKWFFVTGKREDIYEMARQYMVVAGEDSAAPGGYIHSGKFILVDKNANIRGYYDGTDPLAVSDLMFDIERLLNEKK